jgi:assimilatory nitrate reductase catalytic subunit
LLLGVDQAADWIEYDDSSAGTYRAAQLLDERLESCIFVAPRPLLASRSWLAALFEKPRLVPAERANLLTGRPADPSADNGPTVCACFGVGRNAIQSAIADGCLDVRSIGNRLKAGTNCGSCVPELGRLIAIADRKGEKASLV